MSVPLALKVFRAKKVMWESKDHKVSVERTGSKVQSAHRVYRGIKVQRDCKERSVLKVSKEYKERKVMRVNRVHRVLPVKKVNKVSREETEEMDRKASKDREEKEVREDRKDSVVISDPLVPQVSKEKKETGVTKVIPAIFQKSLHNTL
jgi:hypothetical protein